MLVPAASAILPASILVAMPPLDNSVPASPAMASISGVIWRYKVDALGTALAFRGRGVEAVDVGQQHQAIGAHHRGDAGGQAVVVAVADLGGRHRVVLVDDGDRLQGKQRVDGVGAH